MIYTTVQTYLEVADVRLNDDIRSVKRNVSAELAQKKTQVSKEAELLEMFTVWADAEE